MSNLTLNKQSDPTRATKHSKCITDNITTIPKYRIHDNLSYQISRCNYCEEEWTELWVSYRYIFPSLFKRAWSEEERLTMLT